MKGILIVICNTLRSKVVTAAPASAFCTLYASVGDISISMEGIVFVICDTLRSNVVITSQIDAFCSLYTSVGDIATYMRGTLKAF